MTDHSVFIVTEIWIIPGSFEKLKSYRKKINRILEPFKPEIIFHNHAFEWVVGDNSEHYPTGIEVIKFENEETARAALAELATKEIKGLEKEVFSRIRCYFSRYEFPEGLKKEINL